LCLGEYDKFKSSNRNAKIYKILSHKFIEADISVWIDGNVYLMVDENILVDKFLGNNDIAVWKHPHRDCIFDEAIAAKGLYRDQNIHKEIDEQIEYYNRNCFPSKFGLAECNLIIRRHNNIVKRFNEAWWAEICRFSFRDQLSFPVVLKEFKNLKVSFINGNVRSHKYFKYVQHHV
jgi:hypothetical protein